MKRIIFREKDKLSFRIHDGRKFFTHTITNIGDSTILLDGDWMIPLSEIDGIKIDKSNFVTRGLSRFSIDCGIGYVMLDIFNSLVNNDLPTIKSHVVKEGIILIIAGKILQHMMIKKYRIGSRRALKIIDVT